MAIKKKKAQKAAVFIYSRPSAFGLDRSQTLLVQSSWAFCVMSVAKEQRAHVVVEQAGRRLGVMWSGMFFCAIFREE